MTQTAIDALIGSSEALAAALDAQDVDAIEAALPALLRDIEALKASGRPPLSDELRARARHALTLVDTARTRARYLADRNRRRIDLFARAIGRFDGMPVTYGPNGC